MSDQPYEPTQVGQAVGPPTQVGYGAPPPGYGPGGPGGAGQGGFPPPPDRRPWIIGGLVAAILIVLLAIVVISSGGDGDDDDDVAADGSTTSSLNSSTTSSSTTSSSSTSSTSSTTSSTSSTTSTTAPPTTTTEAPPVTIAPATCSATGDNEANPEAAAQTVYDAWTRGDDECARVLMTNAAFNRLFDTDGNGASFEFVGCNPTPDNPEVDTDCAFFTEGTGMHFWMIFSADEGWLVTDVVQVAD